MKIFRTIIFIWFTISLFSCTSFDDYNYNLREVRYFSSSINDIQRKEITLNNGSIWKSDRFVIAVNMSNVLVILEEFIDVGFIYVDGTKVDVNLKEGNVIAFNRGYLHSIKNVDYENKFIELVDGTLWKTPDLEVAKNWGPFPEIIIDKEKKTFINSLKFEAIRVEEIITTT